MNREALLATAKPILFNTEMVGAILDGRKKVTRRVVKDIPKNYGFQGIVFSTTGCDSLIGSYMFGMGCSCVYKKPKYHVGDILYVRETFAVGRIAYGEKPDGTAVPYLSQCVGETDIIPKEYALNNNIGIEDVVWKPSIHMPKEAARIFLKVTNVRVEKLLTPFYAEGSIAMKTLFAEGVSIPDECRNCIDSYGNPSCIDFADDGECHMLDASRSDFLNLWDSTVNKADVERYGWRANPWVWVYEIERTMSE